jgi:hypothetical protein
MKAWSIIGLLFAATVFATVPISSHVARGGLKLSVDRAQADGYGRYRRVYRRSHCYIRRAYRRGYYGAYYHGCVGYFGPGCCGFPGYCQRGWR